MTAQCALALVLLEGRVLTVYNCAKEVGYSNIAREIPRMIEKRFSVEVSKVSKKGTNRYGEPVKYKEYRLNNTDQNKAGRQKMIEFCDNIVTNNPKTVGQKRAYKALQQIKMF